MKLILTDVRMAFANLFVAKKVNGEGGPSYSAVFIIDPKRKDLVKTIKDAVLATATEKWGAKGADIVAELYKKGKVCFSESEKANGSGDVYDGFEGMFNISTRAKESTRPTVIDRDKTPLVQADGRPYSGCFVNANLDIWAQDNSFGKRINCQLRGVQFVRDGDSFGGGSAASADEFADLGEGSTADDLA
jgi:hypothetical protein